jgi:hypothetical protein
MCVKYSVKEERYNGLSEFLDVLQKRQPTKKQSTSLQAYLRNVDTVDTHESGAQTCNELIEPFLEEFIEARYA